jgi:pyruvate formate lyase activating enzyme
LRARGELRTAEELAAEVDERTACICYFGGDPTPAIDHAIAASRLALEATGGRVRICWETNGAMSRALLREATELSATSGGCVKFDLKAWSEPLHVALTGVSNRATLANFEWLMGEAQRRPEWPLAIASTLLVPGYIDAQEVGAIARFIASVDPTTPYALLAFHPDFVMTDLPTTDRALADACLTAAHEAGLTRVRLGNIHLL